MAACSLPPAWRVVPIVLSACLAVIAARIDYTSVSAAARAAVNNLVVPLACNFFVRSVERAWP